MGPQELAAVGRAKAARSESAGFACETISARSLATRTVVLAWSPASRALLRMVEIGERRLEVAPERRAFEVAFALGV